MNTAPIVRRVASGGIRIVISTILLFSIPAAAVHAQEHQIKFEHISLEQGLSQSTVYSILQDSRGFMWFATADGLNKYDGYRFNVYKPDPDNFNSLNDIYIRRIYEDRSGTLWIGTFSGGLNKFDREREQFTHYKHDANDPNSLSSNYVWSICEDRSGALWIGTYGDGLNKFDRQTEQFVRYQHDPDDPNSLSSNYVTSIWEDKTGALWIGTSNGVDKFEREKKQFRHYRHDANNPKSLSHRMVWAIHEDSSGTLWFGTYGGLNRFDSAKEEFHHYQHDSNDPNSVSTNDIRSIYQDKSGTLWIGTYGGGLNQFDPEEETFTRYQPSRNNPHSLSDVSVGSMYEDNSGILWIGTYAGGLNKFDRTKTHFSHYQHDPNDPNGLNDGDIRSIYEDGAGAVWVGTFAGGLNKFDREKNRFSHYRHNSTDPHSLSHDYVMSICEDQSGTIWIGAFQGGLNKFDRATERFSHYQHDPDDPNSLGYGSVMSIYEDISGTLWMGTSYGGLNKFDRKTEHFKRYQHDPDNPNSLGNNTVWTIYEDTDDPRVLWIGTHGGGLNRFDRQNETFISYKNDPDDPSSISNNDIRSIYEDESGAMWIGTSGGLNHFDRDTETFTRYREKDGLPNDVVYGILEDDTRHLWLSTNKGLAKFTPPDRQLSDESGTLFRNYDVNDGLQSNEFNAGAYHKSRSGEVLFGGVNGFNVFDPSRIKDSPHVPPVVITDFQIFNESLPILTETLAAREPDSLFLNKHISETDEIILSYRENVFSFEFAALHYALPQKNQYAYKMEGFDADWVFSGNRRSATYTNLDPGKYVFKVKGSNKDGIWNETGTALTIAITPPFWQTWWFRILAVASVVAIVFGWYKRRIRNIEAQKRELEIQVAEKTKKLRLIGEGTAPVTGEAFFHSLAGNLGPSMGARYCFVSEFSKLDTRVRTLAFWSEAGFLDNVEYDLSGTPCEKVLQGKTCHYPKGVQALFPEDKDLVDLGVESYTAVPLTNLSGQVLGHLAILDDKPMPAEPQDLSVFKIFAARAAAELERKRVEETLRESEERYKDLYGELRITQGQLVQSEKIAAVGKLTAGIVHEINTPAGALKSTMDTMNRCGGKIDRILENGHTLEDIKNNRDYQKCQQILKENRESALLASERISDVVTSLKRFTRLDGAEFEKVDIREGLDSALTLIQHELADGVRVEKHYNDIPKILCYPGELNQTFMTILRNAAQAIEGKGTVSITTSADQDCVSVKISDTGKGMQPDTVTSLFDFRFTAKGSRMGVGMGLISAHNIIQKHSGEIDVESEFGKGSTFTITLPIRQER